jgi:hypothetical protein
VPGVPFVRGVNLPWLSYGNDFGRSAWNPGGGVNRPDRHVQVEAHFARLASAHVSVVRWFVLCDGRSGLCEEDDGGLAGVDDCVLHDFKVAVNAAEAHGIALIPVLLDFHWCHPAREHEGVQCGGRGHHITDSGQRGRLLHHVIRPLLAHFGQRPGIAAWDVINEPEWVTFSWRSWDPRHAVLPDVMRDFIAEAVALVHECTEQPATVGLACPASLPLVRGLGLDLLQAHWYDRYEHECPVHTPVVAWGAEVPVLLGEFPTRGTRLSPFEFENMARQAGYSGALAWSVTSTDDSTDADAVWRWLQAGHPAGVESGPLDTQSPARALGVG